MFILRWLLLVASLPALAFAASPSEIRNAAAKAVSLIQKVNAQWKNPCFSCHHQTLGDMAVAEARLHGVPVDEKLALEYTSKTYRRLLDLDGALRIDDLIDPAVSEGAMLLGAKAAGIAPSLITAIYARHIASNQQADGHWRIFDNRPPQSASKITATAVAVRAILHYLPNDLTPANLERARKWLTLAKPFDTEDSTYRLLGLHWANASEASVTQAAKHLASLQQPDGAWKQTPTSQQTDAYATAEALYALAATGRWKSGDKSFESGMDWLLRNQKPDGSWYVKSRILTPVPVSPPYFESGFPHAKDQFISAAATALGVMALAQALPVANSATKALSPPAFDEPKLSWAKTVFLGNLDELATIDPNSKTAKGTTALMLAAHKSEKVALLLKRGANPKATSDAGIDALMIASLYGGNTKSIEMLLAAGANPNPTHKVRFDAHALAHATMTNDVRMVQALLRNGADPNRPMRLLGGSATTPLLMAAQFDNGAMIQALVKAGAKVDAPDSLGITALSAAALGFKQASTATLLSLGANPKHKDSFGLTPLDHTKGFADVPEGTARLLRNH